MQNFVCINCKKEVITGGHIGTHQRNHCPFCLYSQHVDNTPGDRNAICHGMMAPIGLTFKREKNGKAGEIMLVHLCKKCGKLSINRIAGDDNEEKIMEVFRKSLSLENTFKQEIHEQGIDLLGVEDEEEIKTQLFGN